MGTYQMSSIRIGWTFLEMVMLNATKRVFEALYHKLGLARDIIPLVLINFLG